MFREGDFPQVQVNDRVVGRALKRLLQILARLREVVLVVLIDAEILLRRHKPGIDLQSAAEVIVGLLQIALSGAREPGEVEQFWIGGMGIEQRPQKFEPLVPIMGSHHVLGKFIALVGRRCRAILRAACRTQQEKECNEERIGEAYHDRAGFTRRASARRLEAPEHEWDL